MITDARKKQLIKLVGSKPLASLLDEYKRMSQLERQEMLLISSALYKRVKIIPNQKALTLKLVIFFAKVGVNLEKKKPIDSEETDQK